MPQNSGFDFKKDVRALIRSELRPFLYEQGFVLSKPTTYIRERQGLLQEFYFKVQENRLRSWVSYRPVFDTRPIVSFGTDGIYPHDCLDPYRGFGWVTFPDWHCRDTGRQYKNYTEKFLPRFEELKKSILNGVLPELNEMHSLDQFISAYKSNELLFEKRIQTYMGADSYFSFISGVRYSHGMERLDLIRKEMEEWGLCSLPKAVREYLQALEGKRFTDSEADTLFHGYCNKIREANKLQTVMPHQERC